MTRGFIFVIGVGEQQLYMFSSKKKLYYKGDFDYSYTYKEPTLNLIGVIPIHHILTT